MLNPIDQRPFGSTELHLTCVGLGGEGVLRTHGKESAAREVVHSAAQQGIGYFDTAVAYEGSQAYYGHFWRERKDMRENIFQTSKSAQRDKKGALADLHQTLATMGIEYLDLWQIHDVRNQADLNRIEAPGGALEAFLEAKEKGKARYIGVTGHHDPAVLTQAVQRWPVDTVLLPVNPVEEILGGFMNVTLTAAREKGLAVIAMKVLGASHYLAPDAGITAERLIRYALSHDISVAIVGCSSRQEVEVLAQGGRQFEPLSPEEHRIIIQAFQPVARRLAFYRGPQT